VEPTVDNPRLILGLKLRNLRRERGLTLRELAASVELSISYLSEIEKGKKYPKPEKLLLLAEAFGIPFDDLVSLKVSEELSPLKAAMSSPFLREFPFELFGLDLDDLLALIDSAPARAAAMIRTFLEVGRTYDVRVEHFLLAALRSYQHMHMNYFEDLERAAAGVRSELGQAAAEPVTPEQIERVLAEVHGYEIDTETLPADPHLRGFRSVFRAGKRPKLYINGRLLSSQRAFVLGRELGYRVLGLTERAVSSSWLKIESFDQVLNNFKASYFSGALLLDEETVRRQLATLFTRERWEPGILLDLMRRYDATPETFFHRLSQLLPRHFGLEEIYFMRFSKPAGAPHHVLTKVLNMSRVPVPHGIGLNEHYCRRWPAMRLLREGPASPGSSEPTMVAQRSYFLGEQAEFFVISTVRPLALDAAASSSVSLGFLLNDTFRDTARFWQDGTIPRREVNLTCERCPLPEAECAERVAPPLLWEAEESNAARGRALAELLAGG